MRLLGWVLIPQDWGPYKKRSGRRHTQTDDHVRTRGEDGCLHAEERGPGRSRPCPPLDLGLRPLGLGTTHFCGSSPATALVGQPELNRWYPGQSSCSLRRAPRPA